jgi:hypothetical protein
MEPSVTVAEAEALARGDTDADAGAFGDAVAAADALGDADSDARTDAGADAAADAGAVPPCSSRAAVPVTAITPATAQATAVRDAPALLLLMPGDARQRTSAGAGRKLSASWERQRD